MKLRFFKRWWRLWIYITMQFPPKKIDLDPIKIHQRQHFSDLRDFFCIYDQIARKFSRITNNKPCGDVFELVHICNTRVSEWMRMSLCERVRVQTTKIRIPSTIFTFIKIGGMSLSAYFTVESESCYDARRTLSFFFFVFDICFARVSIAIPHSTNSIENIDTVSLNCRWIFQWNRVNTISIHYSVVVFTIVSTIVFNMAPNIAI